MLPPEWGYPLPRLRAALQALLPDPGAVRWALDAGCGACPPARTLHELFPAAVLLGIDRDPFVLRGKPFLRLIVGDVARLPLARSVRFDLILIRHPDVDRHLERWRQASMGLPGWLRPEGRMLVSCYAAHEVETMRAALLAGGARPLDIDVGLPPVDLAGQDRYVLGFAPARW